LGVLSEELGESYTEIHRDFETHREQKTLRALRLNNLFTHICHPERSRRAMQLRKLHRDTKSYLEIHREQKHLRALRLNSLFTHICHPERSRRAMWLRKLHRDTLRFGDSQRTKNLCVDFFGEIIEVRED